MCKWPQNRAHDGVLECRSRCRSRHAKRSNLAARAPTSGATLLFVSTLIIGSPLWTSSSGASPRPRPTSTVPSQGSRSSLRLSTSTIPPTYQRGDTVTMSFAGKSTSRKNWRIAVGPATFVPRNRFEGYRGVEQRRRQRSTRNVRRAPHEQHSTARRHRRHDYDVGWSGLAPYRTAIAGMLRDRGNRVRPRRLSTFNRGS